MRQCGPPCDPLSCPAIPAGKLADARATAAAPRSMTVD
ncbi:hypothetical protein MMSP_5227 [Mycobacterium sp. 012931]|nr:hypothetical protein MMSP_5227 [Mycobacterium sp. 012931]